MKHIKLFEEFEAYNEFELADPSNVKIATEELTKKKIKFDTTEASGITFFVFKSNADLERATIAIENLIDKSLEEEWE